MLMGQYTHREQDKTLALVENIEEHLDTCRDGF
jgi:hypothetical protein